MAGILDWLAGRLGYVRPRRSGYAAAEFSRLTASLDAESQFINTTLRRDLRVLRARSRQAAQNNPYARRFFQMVVDNVAGPTPFMLQAKVKYNKGTLNEAANRTIEEEWRAWGRAGTCEITEKWSWNTLQRLLVRTLAIDGELLIRHYRGPEYGRHGLRLQIIDVDRLNDQANKALPNGGAIHMGVEVDSVGRNVAYHITKRKPANWSPGTPRESERVPADQITHVYIPEFAEQVRGVPWIYAALLQLVHLGAFEEAAVIAARVGASQMGIIQSPDGGEQLDSVLGKDAAGNPQISADPGTFQTLPPGYELTSWSPKYPDEAMKPFVDTCLRGISAALGVAHHNLSNNMEGVNYSSARIAELDERDAWMGLQTFVCEHLHDRVYADWLRMGMNTGALPFNPAQIEQYKAIYWQGRRWAWVDPEREVNAAIKANDAQLKSRTRIVAEQGEDIEDVFDEIAAEQKLAKAKGVTLQSAALAKQPQQQHQDKPGDTTNDQTQQNA